jgi:inhibitor of cysteine peptidase
MAEIAINLGSSGGRVSASAGDFIVVRLSENPTTGYRWQVETAGGVQLLNDSLSGASGAPGAGGERVFRFAAVTPGLASIRATLRRAWESGVPDQGRFEVTVEVT